MGLIQAGVKFILSLPSRERGLKSLLRETDNVYEYSRSLRGSVD